MTDVDSYIDGLDSPNREIVARLRALVLASRDEVSEHIKWNAPSFCHDGDDRITLGLERKGGVRVVLHRGAKPRDAAGFRFDDPTGLVRWAAPDRGLLHFSSLDQVESRDAALASLFGKWLDAVAA